MAIRERGPQTTNELLSVLTEFEEATSFCETPRHDNRQRNVQNNGFSNDRNHINQPRRENNGGNRFPPRSGPSSFQAGLHLNQIDVSENEEASRP